MDDRWKQTNLSRLICTVNIRYAIFLFRLVLPMPVSNSFCDTVNL